MWPGHGTGPFETMAANNNKKKKKVWKVILILALLVCAAVALYFFKPDIFNSVIPLGGGQASKSLPAAEIQTATVEKGDIKRTVTGSGIIQYPETEYVECEEGVKIKKIKAKVGDIVSEGDVLATYDEDSVRTRFEDLQGTLQEIEAELSYRPTEESVISPISGRIKELYIKKGDIVDDVMKEKGSIALLSTDGKMQITVKSSTEVSLGKQLQTVCNDAPGTCTVIKVLPDGFIATLPDNGVKVGDTVTVKDWQTEIGQAEAEIHAPAYVYGRGGTVNTVSVTEEQNVAAGSALLTISGSPTSAYYETMLREREKTAENIVDVYKLLDNPVLTATADGVITEITADEKQIPEGKFAFTMHTGGANKMILSINEFDICSVQLGQKASVALDALPDETFEATVTRISKCGTFVGSITMYEVELQMPDDPRFMEGMNGTAEIIVEEKHDVITIPVDFLYEDDDGEYVYRSTPDGPEKQTVKTGVSSGTDVEILEGIDPGATVVQPE